MIIALAGPALLSCQTVLLQSSPDRHPCARSSLRRNQLQDMSEGQARAVRQSLGYTKDQERAGKNIFYRLFTRTVKSPLMAGYRPDLTVLPRLGWKPAPTLPIHPFLHSPFDLKPTPSSAEHQFPYMLQYKKIMFAKEIDRADRISVL